LIFRKKKYYFNHDTLNFEEIKYDKMYRVRFFLTILSAFFLLALTCGFFINNYVFSVKTNLLERKVTLLAEDLQQLWEKSKEGSEL